MDAALDVGNARLPVSIILASTPPEATAVSCPGARLVELTQFRCSQLKAREGEVGTVNS